MPFFSYNRAVWGPTIDLSQMAEKGILRLILTNGTIYKPSSKKKKKLFISHSKRAVDFINNDSFFLCFTCYIPKYFKQEGKKKQ